jgi:hypothetical protein
MNGDVSDTSVNGATIVTKIIRSFLACLLIGGVAAAHAVPILSIVPADVDAVEGDTIALDVLVGGLDGEFIGGYDLSLGWDPGLLSLLGVVFDTFLDGPSDSITLHDIGPASLSVFEVSLGALVNQTGFDAFRLFSMSFATLGSGVATVLFSADGVQLLSNELGEGYADFGLNGAQISTTPPPVSVPEPPTFALLGLALGALVGSRRFGRYRVC